MPLVTAPSLAGRVSIEPGRANARAIARGEAARVARRPLSDLTGHGIKATAFILSLVLSATLMAGAIGSADYPWAGWFALLPLLFSIRTLTPRWAMACGVLWGSSVFIASALIVETPLPLTVQSFALLSLVPAVYAYLGTHLTRRAGFSALALGFGWIGVELALTPLGLDGGLLAGTQGHEDGSVAYLLQGLLGYGSVAVILAFINGLVLSLLSRVVGGCGSLYIRGSNLRKRLILPVEVPQYLVHFSNPARPRAPPA